MLETAGLVLRYMAKMGAHRKKSLRFGKEKLRFALLKPLSET